MVRKCPFDNTIRLAFGEQVGGAAQRYGYVGAYGYQTDDSGDSPFMHVGARHYDPSNGRFLQRDPIGVFGGLNVYAYAVSSPTTLIDVTGQSPKKVDVGKYGTRYQGAGGRFVKTPWWRRAMKGGGWLTLALICIELGERHLVPRMDNAIEEGYRERMRRINNPRPPQPPTPVVPVSVPPCLSHVL